MEPKKLDVGGLTESQVTVLLSQGLNRTSSEDPQEMMGLLDRALTDSDKQQLRLLLDDLQHCILSPTTGPLSFVRLTGIEEPEAAELRDSTFMQALTSSETSRRVLQHLAAYGELLALRVFPPATQVCGAAIHALAAAALAARHETSVDDPVATSAVRLLRLVTETLTLPQRLKESVEQTMEEILRE